MLPEGQNSPEAFMAGGAGVSALSRLDGLMGQEVSGGAKCAATLVALVWSLTRVLSHVYDEAGLLGERLSTHAALERLLACVESPMGLQVRCTSKTPAAILALERFLTHVDGHVVQQLRRPSKRLAAHVLPAPVPAALVFPVTGPCAHVECQV